MRRLRFCMRRWKSPAYKVICLIMCITLITMVTKLRTTSANHSNDVVNMAYRKSFEADNSILNGENFPDIWQNSLDEQKAPVLDKDRLGGDKSDPKYLKYPEGKESVLLNDTDRSRNTFLSARNLVQSENAQNVRNGLTGNHEQEDIARINQVAEADLTYLVSALRRAFDDANAVSNNNENVYDVMQQFSNAARGSQFWQNLFLNFVSEKDKENPDLTQALASLVHDDKFLQILHSQNYIDEPKLISFLEKFGISFQELDNPSNSQSVFQDGQQNNLKNTDEQAANDISGTIHDNRKHIEYQDISQMDVNNVEPVAREALDTDAKNVGSVTREALDTDAKSWKSGVKDNSVATEDNAQNAYPVNSLTQSNDKDSVGRTGNTVAFSQIVEDGIYWSQQVESYIPKGISETEADAWITRSRKQKIMSLQPPGWNKCGRPKNAFALFMDGSEMCVRYRSPNNRMLQGEILSYWLSRLLTMDNVPPVTLSSVDSRQWSVQQDRYPELGWSFGNHVALIMWIKEMDSQAGTKVLMPRLLLNAYRNKRSLNRNVLDVFRNVKSDLHDNSSSSKNDNNTVSNINNDIIIVNGRQTYSVVNTLVSLAQWGTMIIFDYLTGNYDRVASMQDGAETEKRPSIIEESIRNLRKSKGSGIPKYWLIDNESGLLDAYDLLYLSPENGHRFIHFHSEMLQTMCIFQRRVVKRLRALHREKEPHRTLERYASAKEPLLKYIDNDRSYSLFEQHFSERLDEVIKWINYCDGLNRF